MANTLKIKRGTAATIPQGQLAEPLFTTDTYDLYIGKGAGGNQRIQNYIASGTSSQFLKGDGTLDSTSYQPLITAGTTLQYYRGDKTFQTLDTSVVPENGPIYFTEPRVRATVLTGLNLSGGGTIAATDSILTAFGKVQNQISALVGGATYQGTWNASTNTPTLASGTGTKGYYYVVSVAGSTNLDGITDWKIGDWAIFNGTTWDKVDNTDAVSSVNGFTGAVNLALDNISDVSAASPTNAQLLRFNGTSSLWENWTPNYITGNQTITLSGDISGSGTTTIATTIGALKVTNAMLAGSIDYAKMDGTTVPTWNQNTTGNAATATKLATARTLTIGATGKTFDGSANVSWTLAEIGAAAALSGTSGRVAYWNSGTTIAADDSLLFSPTSTLAVNNVITAAAGGASSFNLISTINAAANNDILYGVRISPTFNNGAFTGVTQRALGVFGDVYINGNITSGAWNGSVIGSSYGGAGTVSGIMKANGSGTVSAAVAGTDYVIPSALSSYLPLSGGTLTGALSGTSATFSSLTNTYILKAGASGLISNSMITDDGTSIQITRTAGDLELGLTAGNTTTAGNPSIALYSNTGLGNLVPYGTIKVSPDAAGNTRAAKMVFATRQSGGTLTNALTIDSSQAATFSSSVTSGGNILASSSSADTSLKAAVVGDYFPRVYLQRSGGTTKTNNQWSFDIGSNGNLFVEDVTGGISALNFARATGAATFSSSVTAGSLIKSTNAGAGFRHFYNNGSGNIEVSQRSDNKLQIYAYSGTAYTDILLGVDGSTTGGNVGIGTTSPAKVLDVYSSATSNTAQIVVSDASSTNRLYLGTFSNTSYISFGGTYQSGWSANGTNAIANIGMSASSGASSIQFETSTANGAGPTERMRITSGGTLQLSGPAQKIYTNNETTGYAYFQIDNTGGSLTMGIERSTGGGLANGTSAYSGLISTNNATPLAFGTNVTERMRITSGGNVGIGTTSPNEKLQVAGAIAATGTATTSFASSATMDFYSGATRFISRGANTTTRGEFNFLIESSNSSIITTAMTITSGGITQIKKGDGADALQIYGSGSTSYWFFKSSATIGTFGSYTTGSGYLPVTLEGSKLLMNTTTDAGAYQLQVSGSVYATAYYESSDIRLKDVLTNSYSENFSAIEFMWKDKRDDKKHWGYAAQDVMKYIPDAIEVNNDGMMTVNYNEAHTWKIAQLEAKIVELEAKLK